MASDAQPTINVTRGRKRTKKSSGGESSSSRSGSGRAAPPASGWREALAESARTVWWAGLGVAATASDEGTRLFREFVDAGVAWEQERRQARPDASSDDTPAAKKSPSLEDELAQRVEAGIDQVLDQVGMPTRDTLKSLRSDIDELTLKVDRIRREVEQRRSRPSDEEK